MTRLLAIGEDGFFNLRVSSAQLPPNWDSTVVEDWLHLIHHDMWTDEELRTVLLSRRVGQYRAEVKKALEIEAKSRGKVFEVLYLLQ